VEIAESQFRRAAWLNPYEPTFRVHWAIALLKLERKPEARELLHEVLAKNPDHREALRYWRDNWPDEQPTRQNEQDQQSPAQPDAEVDP